MKSDRIRIMHLQKAPLGQDCDYDTAYNPELLFPIPRELNRKDLGLGEKLPFQGDDLWTAFELSWLNAKGKPVVAIGKFEFPCTSSNIIESKSFKLYLNSLNQTRFKSTDEVIAALQRDLNASSGGAVQIQLIFPRDFADLKLCPPIGQCIDDLDIAVDTYDVRPDLLKLESEEIVQEELYSDLLKSNCLKTGQPDWATVFITYEGPKIDHASLLKYLISHRNHQGFHEDTVEKIYVDVLERCRPQKLSVFARYTRRGGLDINPFRSNHSSCPEQYRLARQ